MWVTIIPTDENLKSSDSDVASKIRQMTGEWIEDENEEAPKGYLLARNPNPDYIKNYSNKLHFQ